MKQQYSIKITPENSTFITCGNAKKLDDFLTFLRKNKLSYSDVQKILLGKSKEIEIFAEAKTIAIKLGIIEK